MLPRLAAIGLSLLAPACATVRDVKVVTPDHPRPLSTVLVSECGLAVALYIQLDATHLLRADPRQSDLFTAVNGQQRQSTAPAMVWDQAYALASTAVLSSHVTLPCADGPAI